MSALGRNEPGIDLTEPFAQLAGVEISQLVWQTCSWLLLVEMAI